ncbi:MAG: hypothetical protein ACREJR_11090, partial [Candidatus Rokuibacteriota bacterium]
AAATVAAAGIPSRPRRALALLLSWFRSRDFGRLAPKVDRRDRCPLEAPAGENPAGEQERRGKKADEERNPHLRKDRWASPERDETNVRDLSSFPHTGLTTPR